MSHRCNFRNISSLCSFRCVINFVNTPALNINQDVILHLSIRPSERAIVRNHFQDGKWAHEERDGPSVRANETFEIIILAERDAYKIALNGHHLGEFRHRLPLHLVQFVHVSGDCVIDYILFEQDMSSVPSRPSGPHQIGVSQTASPSAPTMPMPYTPMNLHMQTPGQHYQHPPPSYFNQQPPHNQVG